MISLDELDKLEKEATQGEWSAPKPGWKPPETMGMRGEYPEEGWFPEHVKDYRLNSDALDSEEENGVAYQLDEADAIFIAALVNWYRSGGREMVRDGERFCFLCNERSGWLSNRAPTSDIFRKVKGVLANMRIGIDTARRTSGDERG